MRRRRQIRIAHPKIDDVFTPVARRHFQAVNNAEHVRRQSFDPLKLHCFYLRLSETTMLTAFYKLSSSCLQLRRESHNPLIRSWTCTPTAGAEHDQRA